MIFLDNIFIASIAGFASAIIGAMGMGGGGVLLLYLTFFVGIEHLRAQGINLAFFVPIAIVSLVIHTKNKLVDWKIVLYGVSTGAVGVFIGSYFAQMIGSNILSKIFGGMIVIIGARELFFKKYKK